MKMRKFLLKGKWAALCLILFAACSELDELPVNDGDTTVGVEKVGDNEYIVRGGMSSEAVSRGISGGSFDSKYDPDKLYMHCSDEERTEYLTLNVSDNSFSFRMRCEEDSSYTISSDVDVPVGETENCLSFEKGQSLYFSSWEKDVWSNDIKGTAKTGPEESISYMLLQNRTNMGNWREMYRSERNYSLRDLLVWYVYPKLEMKRIISAYRVGVLFVDGNDYNTDLTKEEWGQIITDENGSSPDDWSIQLFLGEFPTKYDIRLDKNADGEKVYYAAQSVEGEGINNVFQDVQYGGGGDFGDDTGITYYGFGLVTAKEYLCTPVEVRTDETVPLESYIVIENKKLNKRATLYIDNYGNSEENYCYPTQNNVEHLAVIYDLRELAKKFELTYVDKDGSSVSFSRSGGDFEMKPIKVIRESY